jgi:4-amino-4-deoxy-L-arabinose transferase-like glycosyltransferase
MKPIVSKPLPPGAQAGLWGVTVLLALSLFVGSQDLPLRDFREVRFAELGREMLEMGDWVLPHLNGSPYLNKPPMVGWLVAVSMEVLGRGELAARLPGLLATLGTALCAGWLVSMMAGPSWGVFGVTLYLGSPGVQYYGRMLSSDVVAVFFMTAALAAFCKGSEARERGWQLLGFALCGLAVLSRGLIGAAYPLGALLVFLLLSRGRSLREVPWLPGGVIFLLVSLPWFLLAQWREPGFMAHHFLEQQLRRVAAGGGDLFVALPRWEILLGFLGLLGPVALLLPWAMTAASGRDTTKGLLWAYGILVVVSVMVSGGRNQTYTLPALAALVTLAAAWLAQPGRIRPPWGPSLLLGFLAAASALGAWLTGEILERVSSRLAEPDLVVRAQVCMAMVAVLLGGSAVWLGRGRRWGAVALMAGVMLPGGWMLSLFQGAMAPVESRRDVAVWVSENAPGQWPLVVADPGDRQFEGTAGWNYYGGRRVLMVRFQEPAEIRAQAPGLPQWIISKEELLEMHRDGKPFVLAATPKGMELLQMGGLPAPAAADGKFQVWVLGPKGEGRAPPATPSQTGRMSSSRTCPQEG